jgi:hypothetical protein
MKKVRWSYTQAAENFGISYNTLHQRLEASGAVPGEDGCFSTAQILAVMDSKNPARDSEALHRAENWELRVRLQESKLIDRSQITECLERTVKQITALLEASDIEPYALVGVKLQLGRWRECIDAVAARASHGTVKDLPHEEEPKPTKSKPLPPGPMTAYRASRERESVAKSAFWVLKNGMLTGRLLRTDHLNMQLEQLMLTAKELILAGFPTREAGYPLLRQIAELEPPEV